MSFIRDMKKQWNRLYSMGEKVMKKIVVIIPALNPTEDFIEYTKNLIDTNY